MNSRLVSQLSDNVQELKQRICELEKELHDVNNKYSAYKMWHDSVVRGIPVKPIASTPPLSLVKAPEDIL